MSLFGGSKSSSRTENIDNRAQASEYGRNIRGSNTAEGNAKLIRGQGATLTEAGGVTVGKKGKFLAANATDLSSAMVKGDVTVTTADPAIVSAALDAMQKQSTQSTAATNSLLTRFMDSASTLAETGATGGADLAAGRVQKILLGALLIVGAVLVVGVWVWKSKK